MSTFLFYPQGLTVKVIAMDCGRQDSRAMTTISVGHCPQNMFFLCKHNYINCTSCNFFRHTYLKYLIRDYKYLINITYNYEIKTDSLHKFIPF